MNAQVVVLAAVAVLLHVSAGRAFFAGSINGEHQLDAGDGTGLKQVSEESDVSNQDLDAGNLILVKERVGNDLHDIRRREAPSKKRPGKRQGESGDESGVDQKHEPNEEVLTKGISDILEPPKEKIIHFMKPIFDRIKHKQKRPSPGNSSESPPSPAPSTPAPSSDSDASTSSDSDASGSSDPVVSSSFDSSASNSSDSDTSNSTTSDAFNSTNSDTSAPSNSSASISPVFPNSFSKCGENERQRSMSTLSLLFPELQSNDSEQPFVFVPLTNTLLRVVEQQIMGESRSGGDPRRKVQN